jgi:tetratricopeptide (TPR) repeat protein
MTLILETSAGRTTLETLREKYEHEPRSKLFMPLADQLRVRGEYAEAIELCRRGKDLHPRYVSCRVLLGRCLMELGMQEEARRELEEVLELDRENVVSLRVMAEILRAQGRLSEATDYYRAALRINPVDMDAQERLGGLMRLQESPDDGKSMPWGPFEDRSFDVADEPSTETIELDASALSAKWDSFSLDRVQTAEPSISGAAENTESSMSQEEPVTEEGPASLEETTPEAQSEVEDKATAPSLPPAATLEEKPPLREAVQFFNYEVKRSDFSRFTDWIKTVKQEEGANEES